MNNIPALFAVPSMCPYGHHLVGVSNNTGLGVMSSYYREVLDVGGRVSLVMDRHQKGVLVDALGADVVEVTPNTDVSYLPRDIYQPDGRLSLSSLHQILPVFIALGGQKDGWIEVVREMRLAKDDVRNALQALFEVYCPDFGGVNSGLIMNNPPGNGHNPAVVYELSDEFTQQEREIYAYLLSEWLFNEARRGKARATPAVIGLYSTIYERLISEDSETRYYSFGLRGMLREARKYYTGVGFAVLDGVTAQSPSPLRVYMDNHIMYKRINESSCELINPI